MLVVFLYGCVGVCVVLGCIILCLVLIVLIEPVKTQDIVTEMM